VTDRLLTAAEVAERLSVPVSWVRSHTRDGDIPHVKLGKYPRYEWPAVVLWIEEQRAGKWRKHQPTLTSSGRGV
jgi:excisionase family DNA binding protein